MEKDRPIPAPNVQWNASLGRLTERMCNAHRIIWEGTCMYDLYIDEEEEEGFDDDSHFCPKQTTTRLLWYLELQRINSGQSLPKYVLGYLAYVKDATHPY